jgi:hypothetical protein
MVLSVERPVPQPHVGRYARRVDGQGRVPATAFGPLGARRRGAHVLRMCASMAASCSVVEMKKVFMANAVTGGWRAIIITVERLMG